MAYNETELNGLFTRVLNEAKPVDEKDESFLVRYMNEIFADGYNPSSHEVHQFNNLVVKKAEEIARQRHTELLKILADVAYVGRKEAYVYEIPKEFKAKAVWAAEGTSVERQRVDASGKRTATPKRLQGGFYYEPESLATGDIEKFRELVNGIADAKLKLIWESVSALTNAAIANNTIPTKNVLSAANVSLANFRKLGQTLNRYGGNPVFIGDSLLIDAIAQQQVTDSTYRPSASEARLEELFNNFNIAKIGPITALPLVNPFVAGSGNTKTELPVNEGFMFAGAVKTKPFKVIEFGQMTQDTVYHRETEQVEVKFYQSVAIEFVQGEAFGYVKDTAVVL